MRTRLRNSIRQLRWKLTFSYTAVTVGTLLIVVLTLALLVFPAVLTPGGAITADDWIAATDEQVVPIFYGALIQSPPDRVRIQQLLQSAGQIGATITGQDFLRVGQIQLTAKATAEIDFALVGSGGELLGTSHRGLLPLVEYGQTFDPQSVPGLAGPLEAALAGRTDPEELFSVLEPEEEFIWVVPVLDTNQQSEAVLGAVIVKLDSFPARRDLAYHSLTLVARGLLLIVLGAGLVGGLFGSLTAEGIVSRFGRLWTATEAWSRGDFSRFVHDPAGDEISQLARRLNAMAVQLKELLTSRQQVAVAEERNRLARDLHDSAKQQALAASFQLGTALALLDQDPAAARKHLVEAEGLVDSVRLELTDLIHELRPPDIEGRELDEAIRDYAVEWAHQNDIRLDLELDGGATLSPEAYKAVYRIVQEALANVARHSRAATASIGWRSDPAGATLLIRDDGSGFDTGAWYGGMGLKSMRERAESLDGTFSITSEPGRGTAVSVTVPLD